MMAIQREKANEIISIEYENKIFRLSYEDGKMVTSGDLEPDEAGRRMFDVLSDYLATYLATFVRQKMAEAFEAELSRIVDKKFPLGERAWCIECAQRIKQDILSKLKGEE